MIYFLGLGAWTCSPSHKPGEPLVTLPELCIILSPQEEAAQCSTSLRGDSSPVSPKLQRWMAEKVLDCNISGAGMSPSFRDLLTPAQSPKPEKWETRTEKQMGAIYPGCSHERLPGKSD